MSTFYLCPFAAFLQLFSDVGTPLSGALIWTYQAGTSTPTSTWTDDTGVTPNSNPIQLNSAGRLNNVSIWQSAGVPIKVVFSTNAGTTGSPVFGTQIGPTFDGISGINDFTLANSQLSNPASGSGADLVANAVRSYDVFATARAADTPVMQTGQTLVVIFEGGVSIADTLGGAFYWNANSTATDDGINIIAPTGVATGRYLRLVSLQTQYAVKPATTSMVSTTAITIDSDLQIPLLQAGTYVVEGWLNDAAGTSSGGLQGEIAYSGSIHAGYWSSNGIGTGVTAVPLTAIGTAAEMQSAQSGVGGLPIQGMLQCSTTGTLSFQWAQHSSNATASVVGAGSWLRATRVSATSGTFSGVTHTYSSAVSSSETIPNGATTATIEVWGASGGGGAGGGPACAGRGGGGGASGGYSKSVLNVSTANGQTLNFTVGAAGSTLGGSGTASAISSGSFSLTAMTANGGTGGAAGAVGTGGTGGTAAGGNTSNITGNNGTSGGPGNPGGSGGAGHAGTNGTGTTGGTGGSFAGQPGTAGGNGLIVFKYT